MLTSQCKNLLQHVPDRYVYLAKLLVLSASFHAFFLLLLVGVYHYQHSNRLTFTINQLDTASIKLMPMVKTIPGSITSLSQKLPVTQQTSTKTVQQKKQQKKTVIQKAPPSKKVSPPKTTLAQKSKPRTQSKASQKKMPKKKIERKSESSKLAMKKKVEQDLQATTTTPKQPEYIKKDKIIYLGRDDFALLHVHNRMQEEIQKTWNPPVGLSKGLVCTIKVNIDSKGAIADLAIEESSRVISYDISARMALSTMSFPKELWAKEVVITFKQ